MADQTLDTKGLKCPLPVLKARKALQGMEQGDTLTVEATDPGSQGDFKHFCEQAGHALLDSREADAAFTYVIRKGG